MDTRPGLPIIEKLTSNIMRGDKIGIIGPNGCGKSTLIKLLLVEQLKAKLHHEKSN
jgi:ATP-binding cassette subfamily F protein uup